MVWKEHYSIFSITLVLCSDCKLKLLSLLSEKLLFRILRAAGNVHSDIFSGRITGTQIPDFGYHGENRMKASFCFF